VSRSSIFPPYSALFLDSGGGWCFDKASSFFLFKAAAFSVFSVGERTVIDHFDRKETCFCNPLYLLDYYLCRGYFAVGYIGYEFLRFTEDGITINVKKERTFFPEFYFLFFEESKVSRGRIENLDGFSNQENEFQGKELRTDIGFLSSVSKDMYLGMVRHAREYIARGDIYQVNLSRRFSLYVDKDPVSCFFSIYRVQPVPFGCYIDFGDFKLISGSMELFLRKRGNKIVTKPIKGTIRRGDTEKSDDLLRAELINNEKERAENLMIVDLMRNDLSKICRYGTVRVNKLFYVESYSTLHQMVSEVEGELENEVSIGDIIIKTFPPGSVTGAPKRRALEIIDELEPHLRGPYCGVLGIFFPNGDFVLSVGIRILVLKGKEGIFWTGSGIVWDSDPVKEYEETVLKARFIKIALGII